LIPIQIIWDKEESKEIRKRILRLSDKKIEKLFELSGLRFSKKDREVPISEIVKEIRKQGIKSGKLTVLIEEGFLDYNVDGKEIIRLVEKIEKEKS